MIRMFAAAAAVLAAAPVSGSAQTSLGTLIERVAAGRSSSPASTRPVDAASAPANTSAFPLGVAGVRLGMTADEARTVLRSAGYSIRPQGDAGQGPSFASQVRAEAERRRTGAASPPGMADRVTTGLEGVGPNREAITVSLAAVPAGGSSVIRVQLVVPSEVMKGDAFLRQATARYGVADGRRDMGLTLAWCSAPLKTVCGSISPFQRRPDALPNLTATTVLNRNVLLLRDGTEQDRARERAYVSAVERAAPPTDRAAF